MKINSKDFRVREGDDVHGSLPSDVGLARDVFAPKQNASYGPAHHLK
jgi:hypothetical protein